MFVGLAGCGDNSSTVIAGTSDPLPADFAGGVFQLHVQDVDDRCLDGALEVLFMPGGGDGDYALINQTFIPGAADLPNSYVLKLEAPFNDMSITMEASPSGMEFTDAVQSDVRLSVPGTDDCTADITFVGAVRIDSADAIGLTVTATLSDLQSPTETCPVLQTQPCDATLSLRGARAQ